VGRVATEESKGGKAKMSCTVISGVGACKGGGRRGAGQVVQEREDTEAQEERCCSGFPVSRPRDFARCYKVPNQSPKNVEEGKKGKER